MEDTHYSDSKEKRPRNLSYYARYYLNINYRTIQGRLTLGFLGLGGLAIVLVIITHLQWRSVVQQGKYALSTAMNSHMYSSQFQNLSKSAVIYWQQENILHQALEESKVAEQDRQFAVVQDSLAAYARQWRSDEPRQWLSHTLQDVGRLQTLLKEELDSSQAAQQVYSTRINPLVQSIHASLEKIKDQQSHEIREAKASMEIVETRLDWVMPIYVLFSFGFAYFIGFLIINGVLARIRFLKLHLRELSKGNLPENIPLGQDEMNAIINEINVLSDNLHEIKEFALYVGKGDFDKNISVFDDQGDLGASLSQMREELRKVSAEEKKRFWANEGFAHFGDTLRSSTNLNDLADQVIQQMVKYLHANQGGLFVIDNEESSDARLCLKSCYAYDRKKYLQKEILPGQGLLGQVWLEGETTYLRAIPADYLTISSGLGGAKPRFLLLVPLKVENKIEGVLELASFRDFEPHEIKFAEKVAESIASTFANVKVVDRTNHLLQQSQEMAEEMKSQEEEMRQNMEELAATQEEMHRLLNESQEKAEIMTIQEQEMREHVQELSATQEQMQRFLNESKQKEAQLQTEKEVLLQQKEELKAQLAMYQNTNT